VRDEIEMESVKHSYHCHRNIDAHLQIGGEVRVTSSFHSRRRRNDTI